MRARWGTRTFGLTLLGGLALAAAAVAAPIGGTVLPSNGGTANWNPVNDGTAYCFNSSSQGYSPVNDGNITSPRVVNDAFDNGLNLFVAAKRGPYSRFTDPNGKGKLKGSTLAVGPAKVAGLEVSRSDTGLAGSPTLRDLIKLQNPRSRAFSGTLIIDSNLGSDSTTVVTGTSSGDTKVTTADRWTVTADSPTAPTDPPVTLVYYGTGTVRSRPTKLLHVPGGASPDCATTRFRVTVPGHSTRYMLLFAEMHGDSTTARAGAKKFNKKRLSSALLKGISTRVQKNILNWDLG